VRGREGERERGREGERERERWREALQLLTCVETDVYKLWLCR